MTSPLTPRVVTVFGGSGFVGKHIVRALVRDGWRVRVPMRRPHLGLDLKVMGAVGQVQLMQANLRFPDSVARAVEGSDAVVNLVALLHESGRQTFESVHVDGAESIAKACAAQGLSNMVQISAIGADLDSDSHYARTKAEGEARIRAHLPEADILRPSIIFGPEDGFFNRFAGMARFVPALPLFGGGKTRIQPVYVGDVAEAVARVLSRGTTGMTYELGGPQTYSFKELMEFVLKTIDRKRMLLPLPFAAGTIIGASGEMFGKLPFMAPFLTRDQVTLLKSDNVVADGAKTLRDLDIRPTTVEAIVPDYLERYRPHGQFHRTSDGHWVPAEDA